MRIRLGIGLAHDRIRVVAVQSAEIRWFADAEIDGLNNVAETLTNLLRTAASSGWPRPIINAAIGPSYAQLKLIRGLPALHDERALRSIIQETPARFFLRRGSDLLVTSLILAADGEVWAGAIDCDAVSAVQEGCRSAGMSLKAVIPTCALLGRSLGLDEAAWVDGSCYVEARYAAGRVTAIKWGTGSALTQVAAAAQGSKLATLEDQSALYADAYGAAIHSDKYGLVWHAKSQRSRNNRRIVFASIAAALAIAVSAFVPASVSAVKGNRAQRELALLQNERVVASKLASELRRIDDAWAEVSRFQTHRRSALMLLRDLTRGIPDSAALLSLRIDTTAGTLVILAPRVSQAMTRLERLPGITAPEIIGPVTTEVVAGRAVERATIKLSLLTKRAVPEKAN